jgi:transposase
MHAIVDQRLRPRAFVLTPGDAADCIMAEDCVDRVPGIKQPLADKAYDTDAFRAYLKKRRIGIAIPGKANRKKRNRLDRRAYKKRNVIERRFGPLKDFRRIATRCDELA